MIQSPLAEKLAQNTFSSFQQIVQPIWSAPAARHVSRPSFVYSAYYTPYTIQQLNINIHLIIVYSAFARIYLSNGIYGLMVFQSVVCILYQC